MAVTSFRAFLLKRSYYPYRRRANLRSRDKQPYFSGNEGDDGRRPAGGSRSRAWSLSRRSSLKKWPGGISTVSPTTAILQPADKSRNPAFKAGRARQQASTEKQPGCRTEGIGTVTVPSNPRQDIERFLAIGGGSLDLLLDMFDGVQEQEAPPKEAAAQTPGSSTWVPEDYRLERTPDVLSLRRADGSWRSSAPKSPPRRPSCGPSRKIAGGCRPTSGRRNTQIPQDGWWKPGPSTRGRGVLRTERRVLEARRNGWIAKSLAWSLPCESQEELDTMASENRRRAEEEIVELRSEQGELSYKHLEALSPEDHMDRIRAQLARIEWLLERRGRHIISPPTLFGEHESRNSA
jgi:hypothetical protein